MAQPLLLYITGAGGPRRFKPIGDVSMKFVTAAAAIAMTLASCGNTAKQNASSSVKSEAASANQKNTAVLKTSMWIVNYASSSLNAYLGDGERSKLNNSANCLAVGEIKGSIDMLLPLWGQAPTLLHLDDIKKLQADANNLSDKCALVGMQTEQDLAEGAKALHKSLTAFSAKLYQTPG
jgi:hypothetical protein